MDAEHVYSDDFRRSPRLLGIKKMGLEKSSPIAFYSYPIVKRQKGDYMKIIFMYIVLGVLWSLWGLHYLTRTIDTMKYLKDFKWDRTPTEEDYIAIYEFVVWAWAILSGIFWPIAIVLIMTDLFRGKLYPKKYMK